MAKNKHHKGTITRTSRGYEQDLELVMGNDPIRAILELVTNADDAYLSQLSSGRWKITIETERRRLAPDIIRVKDRAGSMTQAEAEERLGKEGGRTSGFEHGYDRRGLLGRGAKDVVHFGPVEWDLKTSGGEHSNFRLLYDQAPLGDWESESIGKSDRKSQGTTVIIELQQRFTLPTHDNLVKYLTRHFGMRPILLDRQNRELRLIDRGQGLNERLAYEPPKGAELARNAQVPIPGYPGQFATINLFQSDQSLDDGMDKQYWRHSLVISSGRASYDVYQGKFAREPWAPYLGRLYGSVDSPYIGELIRKYDDARERGEDPGQRNPVSLLKRDRSGFVGRSEHPFMKALYLAIESYLQPHLERMRRESGTGGATPVSEDSKRRNRNLANLLGQFLAEEELPVDGEAGSGGTLPPIGLSVLPSSRIVEPGNPAAITIRYRHDPQMLPVELPPEVIVTVTDDDGAVTEFPLKLLERTGYYSKSESIGARQEGALSELIVSFLGEEASCIVEWRHRNLKPVEMFAFEHGSYNLQESTRKSIRVLIPWQVLARFDDPPALSITGDSSIAIVRNASLPAPDKRYDCASSTIEVMGRGVGASAVIQASIGDLKANATLNVTASGVGGLRIKYEELEINQRALFEGNTLTVNASDPTIARYLGKRQDGWPGQDELHFRTMLAEVVTSTVARHVIQKRHVQEKAESYRLFFEHMALAEKWLPRVHKVLLPTTELPPLQPSLIP